MSKLNGASASPIVPAPVVVIAPPEPPLPGQHVAIDEEEGR
jgi:hypothetical protein